MRLLKLAAVAASVSIAAIAWSAGSKVWAQNDNAKSETPDSGTMQRADKDMAEVLETLKELGGKPIETLTPEEARNQPTPADAVAALLRKQGKDVNEMKEALGVRTMDVSYPAGEGEQPARLYMPADAGDEPLPVVLYFHGGGFVIADIDVYDATPRALAKAVNALVISAEYRHAPEHKFPAQHEDASAAYRWALENAASHGGDPKRVAVAGESAGGNLALNVAMMARDENLQMPAHMLLVYPVAGNDVNTPSYLENRNAKPLNKAMMEWFFKHTVADEKDKQDPRLNLLAANLSGLPSATVITAEIDPLHSEGEMLADKLEAAGSKVHSESYEGVAHEFFGMAFAVKDAKAANAFAAKNLKNALEKKD